MALEVHVRPLILPIVRARQGVEQLAAIRTPDNWEVDLWMRHQDGHAEVLMECVVPAQGLESFLRRMAGPPALIREVE